MRPAAQTARASLADRPATAPRVLGWPPRPEQPPRGGSRGPLPGCPPACWPQATPPRRQCSPLAPERRLPSTALHPPRVTSAVSVATGLGLDGLARAAQGAADRGTDAVDVQSQVGQQLAALGM